MISTKQFKTPRGHWRWCVMDYDELVTEGRAANQAQARELSQDAKSQYKASNLQGQTQPRNTKPELKDEFNRTLTHSND